MVVDRKMEGPVRTLPAHIMLAEWDKFIISRGLPHSYGGCIDLGVEKNVSPNFLRVVDSNKQGIYKEFSKSYM